MIKENKRAFGFGNRIASLVAKFVVLFAALSGLAATDLQISDANPAAMLPVGSYGLRIISPTVLELTYVTAKQPDPAPLAEWNFVDAGGNFSAPASSKFVVTAGSQTLGIQSIGFKRRPLYAPLKVRDLRVESHLYLQLATAIADGQSVSVTNPDGTLWSSDKHFTSVADPLRLNPAIHVNQQGYMPNFSKKAMIGYYLGNFGELTVSASLGFKLVNNAGTVVYSGALTARPETSNPLGFTITPAPYQKVLQADFTAFNTPGEYRLQVPGLGCSLPFFIDDGLAAAFARTYALGLYHQRCGYSNDFPYSRFEKGNCHTNLVLVPDMSFAAVNVELANMSANFAGSQSSTTPQLKDVASSLYPFVNQAPINLRGGHHDAGDYSKYTINVAQLAHALLFSVDAFPGVAQLDNLGLPESGDGIPDVLQEAKWELDFLSKMQDADGGFYFLVYPRNREYEDDASLQGSNLGDQQVVFPKTTSVTAAGAAALAQAASSPTFKRFYPVEAAAYLAQAKLSWTFLQNAWARYGRAGAYQKITHYGNEFQDVDEVAWLACELYLATGDAQYHTDLKTHFSPNDPNTLRWGWWRMFEGYGCAIRSYAFAVRSGRVAASALDATYLAACENQIRLAGSDQTRFSGEMSYGSSFPDANKPYRAAGWYFSVDQTFDIATAYQLDQRQDYLDAIIANMNFEAGCNPVNMTFITGIGWKRQRVTVNQYAENNHSVLPPTGIPLGNLQQGTPWLSLYNSEMTPLCFPSDGAATAPYAPYDKWTDTFNTSTEMVNPQQAHSLASMAFLMTLTPLKTQAWSHATGIITGLPATIPAHSNMTVNLSAAGLDLSKARFIWETVNQEPNVSPALNLAAVNTGPQWLEVEAVLPDGRRIFATTNYTATFPLDVPANSYLSTALSVAPDMAALYHADATGADATARQASLTLQGNAAFDPSNVGWMGVRSGTSLHFLDLGDKATVTIPNTSIANNAQSIAIEAMVYVNQYKAYNRANALLVSLRRNDWNAMLELDEDMYAGPLVRGGSQWNVGATTLNASLTRNQWHHLRIAIDATGYSLRIDGNVVASMASAEFANWAGGGNTLLELGNFDGWVDEIVIRNGANNSGTVGTVATPVASPSGGSFTTSATVSLASATTGALIRYTTDGSTPTAASTLYTGPLILTASATVKSFASLAGSTDSATASAGFVIASGSTTNQSTNSVGGTTASFIKADATTQGNWKSAYGAEGYNIIGNSVNYPAYAQVTAAGKSDYTWVDPTSDTRALQKVATTDRLASAWYAGASFSVSLAFTDSVKHRVAFYCLDWDTNARGQTIDVLDTVSGTVLSSQSVASFNGGQYLVWDVSGAVTVRFTRTAGNNALLMGIFFDPAANQSGSGSSSANSVFLGSDTATQGNWKGVYGSEGSGVIGNTLAYPSYAQTAVSGNSTWTWAASSSETRSLRKADSATDRLVAGWYSTTNFVIDLNITDGARHRLALYFLDWDNLGRTETIDILDGSSGAVLNSQTISGFSSGIYLNWNVAGHVKIRVSNVSGANALLNGLFFSAAPATQGVTTGQMQTLLAPRVASGGFQLALSGIAGQTFVVQASTNLVNWTPISTNVLTSTQLNWVDPAASAFTSRFYRAVPTP